MNYKVVDEETGKQQTVHVNRMKLFPEKNTPKKDCGAQKELSEEQYDEIFGDSDSETEFYGFEEVSTSDEEGTEGTTYTIYHITSAPFDVQEGCPDNGIGL